MSKLEELVLSFAQPAAQQIGCEAIEAEYKKEGSSYVLRVTIDRTDDVPVSMDDCEHVSKQLSSELDRADPIKEAYCLEVCSPGIDRQLKREKDFLRFMGREVDVKLFSALPKSSAAGAVKELSGILSGYEDGQVSVCLGSDTICFALKDAVYVRLAVRF